MATVLTDSLVGGPQAASPSHSAPDLSYRPDIDGLRALAVLSVVGFHASSTLLPGGYIGVDIFFVISGFLITSIICRNLESGKFTFVDFYARRAKRIFPSLIIVLAAVWALGWFGLLSDELQQLGKHIAAGAGFISNFALWQESGYFDKAAEYKPLLHLWSLGIEEQFYLLWPLIMVWAWRRKANIFNVACGIVALSFVINVVLVSLWQSADAFYLPPTRFWELLAGGALGYAHLFRKKELSRFESLTNVQSVVGSALLLIAILSFGGKLLFPGWWALMPTWGALLVINAGPEAWINRNVFSRRPVVFVGLISYPLYLWHWPLLSFAHILEAGSLSAITVWGAVGLAFVLASLTYVFVEKPIRSQPNRAALVLVPGLAVCACFGIATFARELHPRSERYGLEKIIAATNEKAFPGPHLKSIQTPVGYLWAQGRTSQTALFVGDSNAEQYYPRIDKILTENPKTTKGVLFVTENGCAPIPYMERFAQHKCAGLVERALSLAQDSKITDVVIAARWIGYDAFQDPVASEQAYTALESTLSNFRRSGRNVYLILPIPAMKEFDPFYMVSRGIYKFGFEIVQGPVDRKQVTAQLAPITSQLVKIANSAGARVIDPVSELCGEVLCATTDNDGLPVYRDLSHLRPSYVRDHIRFLDDVVRIEAR
jgi:peptidoglycan/LPS O-acetylase OafA/YrhL